MRKKEDLQLDLFDFSNDKYYISKPIRLIEFFAGIGFTHQGIKRVFPNVESWRIAEWGIPSILGYDAVHNGKNDDPKKFDKDFLVQKLYELGISANYDVPATEKQIKGMSEEKLNRIYNAILRTHNLVNIMNVKGDDLGIVDTDAYEYILTYSFPCQDLSLAGDKKGMSVSQAEGGTRSGLVWEVLRILTECKEKPQILIMENVPQIHSVENIKEFVKLQLELEKLGYANFWKDLNGTDFGVPQNRVRTFMVSILGKDNVYSFPEPTKLTKKLLDVLEDNVDEKYYLSSQMIEYISASNEKWTGNNDKSLINKDVGSTLNTREGRRRCDASNYICDDLPENTDLKQIGNIYNNNYNSQAGRVYDANGLAPTLDTMDGGNRQPKIVDDRLKVELCNKLINEGQVKVGDVVKHSYTQQILDGKKKGVEKESEMITLTTRPDCVGVCVDYKNKRLNETIDNNDI